MYLLNKLNDVGLKYEIHTKEYHWHYFGEESPKATGEFYGECLGIRIIVNLNDRYKVSIIQAFNEATGDFMEMTLGIWLLLILILDGIY